MRVGRAFNQLKRPRVYLPLAAIILILATAVAIIKNLNAPAVGSVSQTPPSQAEQTDPYAQPGTYHGKYVSFRYPAHYKKVPSALTGSTLETVDYLSTNSYGKHINVAVFPGSISSESAVSYRRSHKDLYNETDRQSWVEFTKKDSSEDTFFIEHSGRLASVSMTAPNGDQSGDGFFVASSLKWL